MKSLLAHELLECITTGDLETDRDGDLYFLLIGTDRIFEASVTARVTICHELSTHNVTVLADDQVELLVTCLDVEDAISVSDLLARCLVVPIAD